ncbi:Crp/Fnr family transcriptional regulator [Pistricoccus aurantiacus]|nr:Crp/Fnr family transcriptional regulator [Pistricoccus aurantiacus]
MKHQTSALLSCMERFLVLEADEKRLLGKMETGQRWVPRQTLLWEAGSEVERLFILQEGWACTYRDDVDGNRQIMDVLLPGDIVGLQDFTFPRHFAAAAMLTDGEVSCISSQDIGHLIHVSPRLTIALFAAMARQETLVTERLAMGVHRDARSRLAHFVVEIHTRLNKLAQTPLASFEFPLSQSMLGQLLGLTHVHVNRVLAQLEADKVLKKHRHHIEVFDARKLREIAEFDDAYLDDSLDGLGDYLVNREKARLWEEKTSSVR